MNVKTVEGNCGVLRRCLLRPALWSCRGARAVQPEKSDRQPDGGSAEKVDEIANTVPEAIKSSGKLIVGVNIPYAPNEFKDPNGKIVGFDVDLMNAIAEHSA